MPAYATQAPSCTRSARGRRLARLIRGRVETVLVGPQLACYRTQYAQGSSRPTSRPPGGAGAQHTRGRVRGTPSHAMGGGSGTCGQGPIRKLEAGCGGRGRKRWQGTACGHAPGLVAGSGQAARAARPGHGEADRSGRAAGRARGWQPASAPTRQHRRRGRPGCLLLATGRDVGASAEGLRLRTHPDGVMALIQPEVGTPVIVGRLGPGRRAGPTVEGLQRPSSGQPPWPAGWWWSRPSDLFRLS